MRTFPQAFLRTADRQLNPENSNTSSCQKAMRYSAPLLGLAAGIPLLRAACNTAANNGPLCVIFEIATFISFGLTAVWMFNNAIESLQPITEDESIIYDYSQKQKVLTHVAANTLSVINTAIPAYISYQFNSRNPLFLIISVPVSYSLSLFALYNLLSVHNFRFLKRLLRGTPDSPLMLKLLKQIQKMRVFLLNAPAEEANQYASDLINASNNSAIFIKKLLEININIPELPRPKLRKYLRLVSQFSFLLFPTTTALVNRKLASDGVTLLTENLVILIPLTILMTGVNATIDSIFSYETGGILYDGVERLATCSPPRDYLSAKKPCLSLTFTLITLIIAGLSSSYRIHIANETLGILFITVCAAINTTIFERFLQKDIVDGCANRSVILFKTEDEKIMKSIFQLESFNKLLLKSDREKTADALSQIFNDEATTGQEEEASSSDTNESVPLTTLAL